MKTAPEKRYRPRPDAPFRLTAVQLADWFLDLHRLWFADPTNGLYQQRAACRRALLDYLRTGREPEHAGTNEGYVVLKFRGEVEAWFESEEAPG
jgi:hypothetical protein